MKRLLLAAVLSVCTAPALAMPPLCDVTDDPCVVEHDVEVDTATVALGGRALVIPSGRTVTVRTQLEATNVGTLTLAPNARIVLPDDGRVLFEVDGDIRFEPGSAIAATSSRHAVVQLYTIGGSFVMRGAIRANSASRDGDGGAVFIEGVNVEIAGDGIEASGGNRFGTGGWITVDAVGDLTVSAPIVGRGGDGGGAAVELGAGNDIAVGPAATIDTSAAEAGLGGFVWMNADGDIIAMGDIRLVGTGVGGSGGEAVFEGADVSIGGMIDMSGAGFESGGGTFDATAAGDLTLTGRVVGLADRVTGFGGTTYLFAEGAMRVDGPIDIGRGIGGALFAEARMVRIAAPVDVAGRFGAIGCTVEIAPAGAVRVTGEVPGDRVTLTAGTALIIAGTVRTSIPALMEWHGTPPAIAPGAVEPSPELVESLGTFCFARCGDGFVDSGEECDDGNLADHDCCSATCTAEPEGNTCDDDLYCTSGDVCDGAGACTATPVVCDACERCSEEGAGCVNAPKSGCQPILVPGAGLLDLKSASADAADRLTWRWRLGAATPLAAFGDPLSTTDYALCVYDDDDLLIRLRAPGGAAWRRSGTRGVRYADGTARMALLAGEDGKASIAVKGRGPGLAMPALGVDGTVRVQLESSDGACWTSRFTTPSANLPQRYKARTD
jgi:cysteine-rich repeat protein